MEKRRLFRWNRANISRSYDAITDLSPLNAIRIASWPSCRAKEIHIVAQVYSYHALQHEVDHRMELPRIAQVCCSVASKHQAVLI